MKIVMVSKIVMEFDEGIDTNVDIRESIKNGDVKISIPEISMLDEDGNDLIDDSELAEKIMMVVNGEEA